MAANISRSSTATTSHARQPDARDAGRARVDRLSVISSAKFAGMDLDERWLVEDVLVGDQPCMLGGAKKTVKTGLAIDLAISLATGTRFLDHFRVPSPAGVLFFSGERAKAAVRSTAERVCSARGIKGGLGAIRDMHWGVRLPKLWRNEGIRALRQEIEQTKAKVVILDPLYLCLFSLNSESRASNIFEVGSLLARASDACLNSGATPVFVHQLHKRLGSEPSTLDDLIYAGFGDFTRQWMLIKRRANYDVKNVGHHQQRLDVGGSMGHSSAWHLDIDEGQLKTDFSGRRWCVTVSSTVATLHREAKASRKERVRAQMD